MQYALLLAALAALGSAMPSKRQVLPPIEKVFGLGMLVGTNELALKAIPNPENSNEIYLAANGPVTPVYEGIVAYLNGTGPDYALSIQGGPSGPFGLTVPNVGSGAGVVDPVFAERHFADFRFLVAGNHQITHATEAPGQEFFSCEKSIGGNTGLFLSWGTVGANGAAPGGCNIVELYQVCSGEFSYSC